MNAETIARLLEYFDLKQFIHDNSPEKLLIIFVLMCIFLLFARFLCTLLQKKIEKMVSSIKLPDKKGVPAQLSGMDFVLFERLIKNTRLILYLIILSWALRQIEIGPLYAEAVRVIFITLCIFAAIRFFTAFVPFNMDLYLRRRGATLKTSQSRSLMPITKGVIWAIGLTFLLDNLGFHVSTIIAGLGIVGVAVGLAGQAILADFFSYIVILLDKPFVIGDFVEIGEGKAGEVEYMGPKTTRLRNLDDDLIVCSNSEMTKGTLVNQGSIHEREVLLNIGIAYETPVPVLKKLPDMLRDLINSFPQCSFDRACLLDFGDSSLSYQIIYFVSEQKGGLRDFMITRSNVNVAILAKFADENISIAYPTEHVLFTNLDKAAAIQERPVEKQNGEAKPAYNRPVFP